ncbi:MAG: hypothetical protein GY742_17705 [Hyphomicrobiales bacterium]|nr:hypothetical protein [Hyphomicrobiales bacterium]
MKRQLMEQLDYNLLCRWIIGLALNMMFECLRCF